MDTISERITIYIKYRLHHEMRLLFVVSPKGSFMATVIASSQRLSSFSSIVPILLK